MADLRKNLAKLKVVELKEKLQGLGKTPKGLKADLVNQLAEAYEEQTKDPTPRSAPLQSYPTAPPVNEALLSPERAESQHYYQQTVSQYQMPAQQVYEQTPTYMPPYEPQYQYPTHQVFSPPHEQQYSQSPAPFQITAQLSPRIASQMSPQLSPQMANQLAPPIQPQITQQLSPQMAAQQYRAAEFHSPHRAFQSNESDAYHTEYVGQTEQMAAHFGIPHLEMHGMASTQPSIPPSIPTHPSQLVHRTQVIGSYAPDIPQTQALPPNIGQNLSSFKAESGPYIPSVPSIVPTDTPTDMIDFDDVSIGIDPTNEVQYNQPIGAFGADQNQNEFEIGDTSQQFQTDGQAFSQSNQMQGLPTEYNEDTNTTANEDESTDVDSNDTNQSYSNEVTSDDIKPIGTDFSVQQMIGDNRPIVTTEESPENSEDSVQTDVTPEKEENQYIDDNTNSLAESESNDFRSDANQVIDNKPSYEYKESQEFESQNEVNQQKQESHPLEATKGQTLSQQSEQQLTQQISKPMEEQRLETTIELVKEEEPLREPIPRKEVKSKLLDSMKTNVNNVSKEQQNEESVKQNGLSTHLTDNKKLTKNQKKKLRKKLRANRRLTEQKPMEQKQDIENKDDDRMDIDEEDDEEEIEIEYVPECIKKDPIYFQYLKVFDKFRTGESNKNDETVDIYVDPHKKMMERKKPVELELKDDEERKDGEQKISKRKLKQMTRMTVADLKQRVSHPELVEMHDVTAKDPLLLLHLKATRNSVPVPRHWCYKRKYLQGKRGFEKPPFKLPEFIRKTGIMEMRQALQEKEESKSLKAQMREKIRPKMGKIDIDYQKLHDAFFKWQTKPKMTIHGDLYYEGKEFETRLKEKKPGDLSTELRTALGMPTGPNANKCPPPWLIAMQRYGPPPSYPNIKIPGLNAPIPEGCSFGYHAGGWGKPPVDEYGRPLYGDVFGTSSTIDLNVVEEEVDRTLWGEMESESEEEESSSEEEEEPEKAATAGKPAAKEVDESGFVTPAEGLATPSGLSSVPTGMETPDLIELRKRKQIEAEMESGDNPALFTVIPEKKGDKIGREMMGSAHTYDMSAATLRKGQGIDVALDPSDLEAGSLDSASVAARYEQTVKEQSSLMAGEDLSDMVAEHAARQKRKNKQDSSKSNKKYQFKF